MSVLLYFGNISFLWCEDINSHTIIKLSYIILNDHIQYLKFYLKSKINDLNKNTILAILLNIL